MRSVGAAAYAAAAPASAASASAAMPTQHLTRTSQLNPHEEVVKNP
jgi:hypothetical protein